MTLMANESGPALHREAATSEGRPPQKEHPNASHSSPTPSRRVVHHAGYVPFHPQARPSGPRDGREAPRSPQAPHPRACPVSAAQARRIARLLPGLTPTRAAELTTDTSGRCWMPAEILAALAVTS
jgi:hypothetical protein